MITVQSLQVGQPQTNGEPGAEDPFLREWTSAIWKYPVEGPIWLDTNGLHGDVQADRRHHGGPWRAVLMYPAAHYPRWWEEWGHKEAGPGSFGENVTVLGLVEATACLGDRYAIGEAVLQVTSPRTPCQNLARRHGVRDLVAQVRATHRHGWYLRVVREGWIETGQAVALEDRPYPQWPVERAARVAWRAVDHPEEAMLLAECPALVPEWRESLRAKLTALGRGGQ